MLDTGSAKRPSSANTAVGGASTRARRTGRTRPSHRSAVRNITGVGSGPDDPGQVAGDGGTTDAVDMAGQLPRAALVTFGQYGEDLTAHRICESIESQISSHDRLSPLHAGNSAVARMSGETSLDSVGGVRRPCLARIDQSSAMAASGSTTRKVKLSSR